MGKTFKQWFTIVYHNWWFRAATKISTPVSLSLSFLTFIGVYLGVNRYAIYISLALIIIMNIVLVVIGYYDYSAKGTKVMESYEAMKADYEVYYYYCIYKQLALISQKNGVEIDPELGEVMKFLKKHSENENYKSYIDRELVA